MLHTLRARARAAEREVDDVAGVPVLTLKDAAAASGTPGRAVRHAGREGTARGALVGRAMVPAHGLPPRLFGSTVMSSSWTTVGRGSASSSRASARAWAMSSRRFDGGGTGGSTGRVTRQRWVRPIGLRQCGHGITASVLPVGGVTHGRSRMPRDGPATREGGPAEGAAVPVDLTGQRARTQQREVCGTHTGWAWLARAGRARTAYGRVGLATLTGLASVMFRTSIDFSHTRPLPCLTAPHASRVGPMGLREGRGQWPL